MIEIFIPAILFLIWLSFSEAYLRNFKKYQTNTKLNQRSFWNNTYIFESIPAVYPTLGIFCTALGITIGIWDFNTNDIQNSIPALLKGLRLAFMATMGGIIGLIVYQKRSAVIQKHIDDSPNRPKKQTDELSAISGLTAAVQEMRKVNEKQIEKLIQSFGNDLENKVSSKLTSLEKEVINLQKTATENQKNTNDGLSQINTATHGSRVEVSEHLKKLRDEQKTTSEKANKNTDEIIRAMSENNKLTSNKFDEFSELLRQNNTEALVEVMTRTSEKFNSSMSELINRLVKENFDELNKSVKNLNDWQNQNKEQIQRLTEQFQRTADTFNISSATLKEVAVTTKALAADGSKLSQIVEELKKVMLDDRKFQEITNKLTTTIETLKNTTESFDETTSKLNDWVKTEKNFKEAAQILINKLEEFRDFNGDVWSKYRQEMTKAVSIVKEASTSLGEDLEGINAEFYTRLNSTLQNLDQCIERFVPVNRR